MKKSIFCLSILLGMGTLFSDDLRLKNVEVFTSEVSTQAILFFSGQCNPSQRVSDEEARLTVFFPGVSMEKNNSTPLQAAGDLLKNKTNNMQQGTILNKLNKFGLIEQLRLEYVERLVSGRQVKGVLLDIKFASNKALVKVVHTNEKTKFILEVFSKAELDRIGKATGGPIHLAQNFNTKKKMAANYV